MLDIWLRRWFDLIPMGVFITKHISNDFLVIIFYKTCVRPIFGLIRLEKTNCVFEETWLPNLESKSRLTVINSE